jgi:predicted Zn-dependent peptidase
MPVLWRNHLPQEIDKEVEVICDEIDSYKDSPADLIYDEFENVLFKGHPLGHNILGTSELVRGFKTADAKRFTDKYYRPENSIFFII